MEPGRELTEKEFRRFALNFNKLLKNGELKKISEELGYRIEDLPQPWRFSGQGDALVCGDLVFCGAGYRSDEAALEYAAQHFGLERIQLQTLPLLDGSGDPVTNVVSGWPRVR